MDDVSGSRLTPASIHVVGRVDDRDAREHVRVVDAARSSAAAAASSTRVLTPSASAGRRRVDGDPLAASTRRRTASVR